MPHLALLAGPWLCQRCAERAPRSGALESRERETTVDGQDKSAAVERTARRLGCDDQASRQMLGSLWDEAFDQGRLAALDEFQDRFCVCMK